MSFEFDLSTPIRSVRYIILNEYNLDPPLAVDDLLIIYNGNRLKDKDDQGQPQTLRAFGLEADGQYQFALIRKPAWWNGADDPPARTA